MTSDEEYEETRQEINHVFGERKTINKKFLSACERKLDSLGSTSVENPTKWIIGKLAFQEFEDVYDNFQRLALNVYHSIQNIDQRIQLLEEVAIELGARVNSDDIKSVARFAEEFRKQIEESRKKLEEYKRKMRENDLAT